MTRQDFWQESHRNSEGPMTLQQATDVSLVVDGEPVLVIGLFHLIANLVLIHRQLAGKLPHRHRAKPIQLILSLPNPIWGTGKGREEPEHVRSQKTSRLDS